jgi:peptidoglycan/LPS O-acetylase OafA/YrhL
LSTVDSTTLPRIEAASPPIAQAGSETLAQQPRLEVAANLDILRSIAVTLVLLDHVLETVTAKHPDLVFHPYDWCAGRLGVLLFFVHTSLVLNFSMARLGSTGGRLVWTFLVRRAFRLYPLSILCVLLVFALHVPVMPFHHDFAWHGWGALLSNLALTMNLTFTQPVLGPLWSLPIEAQMYLALPVIFMMLGPARSPRMALALWLVACAAAWVQPSISDRASVIGFAPCFIAGVLAYTLSGRYSRRWASLWWVPFLAAVLSGFAVLQNFATGGVYNRPLGWVFCLAIGLAIPLFKDSSRPKLNALAVHVARYSYGVYLFHCIALWAGCFVLGDWPEPLQWAVSLALVTVMSVGSYHLLEKPAIDYGARITKNRA